uniref:Uncharacterized protein n=1 Tax=Molossus molossus TaxID=27622 RepID=A0A7J8DC02_MOLMO|nr:hypothetical protein HJG59_009387 [Molossus molossus]
MLLRFSLCLDLLHFDDDVFWCGPLGVHLLWDSLCFLDLYVCFFHQVREVFCHYCFKQVFDFLFSLFSFWHLQDVNVGMLEVVPEAPYTILIFLDSFCCSDWAFFASLYSKSIVCFLDLRTLLLNLCKLFFISVNASFISDCASIISDWSFFMLLRPSLSSLRFSLSSLSILLSSILNSAFVRLLISISLSSLLGVLFCSFIWDLFLCLLILAASLCLFLCIT